MQKNWEELVGRPEIPLTRSRTFFLFLFTGLSTLGWVAMGNLLALVAPVIWLVYTIHLFQQKSRGFWVAALLLCLGLACPFMSQIKTLGSGWWS